MGAVALHDSFFKATLGQTGPLSSLPKGFLPPGIARALDFDSLQSVPTESVDDSRTVIRLIERCRAIGDRLPFLKTLLLINSISTIPIILIFLL